MKGMDAKGSLVLSRKEGDSIEIDEKIEISVLRFKGDRVHLLIRAPREIKILRGELKRDV